MALEHFYVKIVYRVSTAKTREELIQWLEEEVVPRYEDAISDIFKPPRWRRPFEVIYITDKVEPYRTIDWEIYPKVVITAFTSLLPEDQYDDQDLFADRLESELDAAITEDPTIDTVAKAIQYKRRPQRSEGDW